MMELITGLVLLTSNFASLYAMIVYGLGIEPKSWWWLCGTYIAVKIIKAVNEHVVGEIAKKGVKK